MALNKGYLTAKTDRASDEVFTPAYAIKPLIKYLYDYQANHMMHQLVIWCPFDMPDSEYVKELTEAGFKVISSHIDEDKNFFYYQPEYFDIIVSNPPFSIKDQVLERLWALNAPYAMLLPIPTLQGQKRFQYMKNCQALVFDKRINYYTNKETKEIQKGVSFGSFYLCKDFLPKDLIFEELEVK